MRQVQKSKQTCPQNKIKFLNSRSKLMSIPNNNYLVLPVYPCIRTTTVTCTIHTTYIIINVRGKV